jgi:hypothetical protein
MIKPTNKTTAICGSRRKDSKMRTNTDALFLKKQGAGHSQASPLFNY